MTPKKTAPRAELLGDDTIALEAAPQRDAAAKPFRVKVPKSKQRALIREFGLDVSDLTEEEALELAYDELHAMRAERGTPAQ